MYKTILVTIDLSHAEPGSAMIKVAKSICDDGGKIILLNVVEDIPAYVAVELPEGLIGETKKRAQGMLDKIAQESGVDVEVEVRTGQSSQTILATAEELGVDLIMVASHRPGLQDYLLGSTAARVVRHATCSVLVGR